VLESRFTEGHFERTPGLVCDLVGRPADALLTFPLDVREPVTARAAGTPGRAFRPQRVSASASTERGPGDLAHERIRWPSHACRVSRRP